MRRSDTSPGTGMDGWGGDLPDHPRPASGLTRNEARHTNPGADVSTTRVSQQVAPQHYQFEQYVDAERWSSYWHQVSEVLAVGPTTTLVVGVGDRIVPRLLTDLGVEVKTFDVDGELCPDYVGDVRNIARVVPPGSVDVVLCCQVLEHLPYDFFEEALAGIVATAKRRVILSLPYCHRPLLHLFMRIPKMATVKLDVVLPCFWIRWKFDGQHYWEVGTKGYSLRHVEMTVERVGNVVKRFFARNNRYHVFFVLEPRAGTAGDEILNRC